MTLFSKLAPLLPRPRSSTSKATDPSPQTRVGSVAAPLRHTWQSRPANRAHNNGFGLCNTGSGKRMICALRGLGCDVDHAGCKRLGDAPLSEAQKEVRADIKRAADNGDWDWAA